jgi:hypothetical protein
MRKPYQKTRAALATWKAITVEQLPPLVPRPLAADFALLTIRTLARAEERGELRPIKRNARSVSYRKEDLLAYLGLTASSEKKPVQRRPAAVR